MFSENVLKTVLSLYMEDKDLPLSSLEEVLICTQKTTEEEVFMRINILYITLCYFKGISVVEKSYW